MAFTINLVGLSCNMSLKSNQCQQLHSCHQYLPMVKQCETYNMYVDILPVARVDICNPGTQTAPILSGNLLLKTKTHTENDAWFFLDNLYVKTCLEPIKRVESCRLFGAMSKSTDPASSARSESSFLRPAGDHHACLKPATQKAVSSNANRTVGIS